MEYIENKTEYFRTWINKLTPSSSSVILFTENVELESVSSFEETEKQRLIRNSKYISSW